MQNLKQYLLPFKVLFFFFFFSLSSSCRFQPKQYYDNDGQLVIEEQRFVCLNRSDVSWNLKSFFFFSSTCSKVSHLDEFFDLVFVVTLAHLGVKFREYHDWKAVLGIFSHWIPMWYNWFILESFLNRFSMKLKWMYFLYFGAFIGVIGGGMNVDGCPLNSFTTADVPYGNGACFDFSAFISIGRCFVVIAWSVAALGVSPKFGKEYCIYRAFAALLPGICYFLTLFFMDTYQPLPILWSLGIGLDIILHVVPSTIVWPYIYIPRHTHYTEERHAMLYIVATGECVIAAGIAVREHLPVGGSVLYRYLAMLGVVLLTFFLVFQNFVASDSAKLEHNGGVHR